MSKKSARPRWQSLAGGANSNPPKPAEPVIIQMSSYHCNTLLASVTRLNTLKETEQAVKNMREAAEQKHYETVNMICQKDDVQFAEGSQIEPDFVKKILKIIPNLAADKPPTPQSNGNSEGGELSDSNKDTELMPVQ